MMLHYFDPFASLKKKHLSLTVHCETWCHGEDGTKPNPQKHDVASLQWIVKRSMYIQNHTENPPGVWKPRHLLEADHSTNCWYDLAPQCLGNEAKFIDCIFPEAAVVFRQIKFHGVPVAKWVSLFCLWCVTSGSADPLMPIRPGIQFPSWWGRFGVGGAMVRSTSLPVIWCKDMSREITVKWRRCYCK